MILQAGSGYLHGSAASNRIILPKRAQRSAKISHIRKRAEILGSVISVNISRYINSRPFLPYGNLDIGIGFIIPQRNIVLRMQFLDQVAFQNQRFHFSTSHGNVQIFCMANHGCYFGRTIAVFPHVGTDAILQVLRLSYINNPPVLIFPAIDPGRIGKRLHFSPDFIIHFYHSDAPSSAVLSAE